MEVVDLIIPMVKLARQAGKIVLSHYKKDVEVLIKDDKSPVTEADLASHRCIVEGLKTLTPSVPIISEECDQNHGAQMLKSEYFWLVDPLDGTKGFIKKNDEFAINIALMKGNKPLLGVIHIPVEQTTYFTGHDQHAYKMTELGETIAIQTRHMPSEGPVVLTSALHSNERTQKFTESVKANQLVPLSSAIKFCRIAEGKADIYPRFGPTMEWDTAAGHAIIDRAGGSIETLEGVPLLYRKPGFKNPGFVVFGY